MKMKMNFGRNFKILFGNPPRRGLLMLEGGEAL